MADIIVPTPGESITEVEIGSWLVENGSWVETDQEVRLFLMNDSVDLARDACTPPESYDQDLSLKLKDLISEGALVKVCGTCMSRCGIHKNQPYFDGAEKSTMDALTEWVLTSDKIITF